VIRFLIEKVYDLPHRTLLISGIPLHGVMEPEMVLGDGTGATAKVLGIEFQSPTDRKLGLVTLAMERSTPSPVAVGTVLTVQEAPRIGYRYQVTSGTVLVTELHSAVPRAMIFDREQWNWRFLAVSCKTSRTSAATEPGREVSRTEAAQILWDMGTVLLTEEQTRRLMLEGEAKARSSAAS